MKKIKIAIIDDQNIFRESLSFLIESISDFDMIAQFANTTELLQAFKNAKQLPDILLMDMNMPDMNGIELNAIMNKKYPQIKVIILSVYAQDRLIAKMVSARAAAYLIKNCGKDELINAIKSTYETGFYINKQTLFAMQQAPYFKNKEANFNHTSLELTLREKEVLELICKENSSAEIAEKLFLSVRTVEGHRNNLLLKTQCRNTAGLVLFAIKNQLFEIL